jgi:hypothetical protein
LERNHGCELLPVSFTPKRKRPSRRRVFSARKIKEVISWAN